MKKLELLHNAKSIDDLAVLLGYKTKSISYILFRIPPDEKYVSFGIPKKSGGVREILAPNPKLKKLQSRLATLLSDCLDEISQNANKQKVLSHGFRRGYSIISNAQNHVNRRYVFNVDLKDFFPSINFGRVRGFFIKDRNFELSQDIATIIAQIACYNNELPQGSPCSPIISNLIGHLVDVRLVRLAKTMKCTYSRYVDDITFSTNRKLFPKEIAFENEKGTWEAGEKLKIEIERAGFLINEEKTSMQYKVSRQITTGLVVNEKINIKKEYYKNARAYCDSLFRRGYFQIYRHNVKKLDENEDEAIDKKFEEGTINQLDGILSYIYDVKRKYDKEKSSTRYHHPNAITKLYRQFLFYRHFFSLDKPLVVCEGKTDVIYLRCAIKCLAKDYPAFIQSEKLQIRFLNFTSRFKDIFAISEGTTGIKGLMSIYKNYMLFYKGAGKLHPVIVIIDTDDGCKEIMNLLKIKDFTLPFVKYEENLYVTFVSKEKDREIEDLFPRELLRTKVDGKTFNKNKALDENKEYGKQVFAEKVVRQNLSANNFNEFKPLLDNVRAIISDYSYGAPETTE